ncbi:Asp/Glu/hydantoin racemase [Candidatus Moduliflexus flocculans]|uniref:Asp/Glu/hydantoin racemase n=1 Tax=Candidatus Moduliflexus flocculans TaxID=1499966 RepID=A0A081BQW5_9BACT|nr:Asp/Glu/hydantoin racemase [Candidatus Moduliflexus flocculans]
MVDLLKPLFAELLPGVRVINIVDDSIVAEAGRAGKITSAITKRLISYYFAGIDAGADVVFNTCSSVGEVADLGRQMLPVPLVKIDEPMAIKAVESASNIGVIATLPTTLGPTVRLVKTQAARLEKSVSVIEGLAEGAFQALIAGDPATHDQMILDTARRLAGDVDLFVLAQASMARMEAAFSEATGKPVLSSPRLGTLAVKAILEGINA